MTPTSPVPMRALSWSPLPHRHPYICWLSVTSGRATIPTQMLILQLRLLPTQWRGLIPGGRSKATPRGPLWLLWGATPSMRTGTTTARMSSGPTSCALRWASMRCPARTRVSLTRGASACMDSRETADPRWPGGTLSVPWASMSPSPLWNRLLVDPWTPSICPTLQVQWWKWYSVAQ